MEYIEKIAALLAIATSFAAAAGFVFKYYLKKFFEKVDRRQEKIEGMIQTGIKSLQDGFADLSRDHENARKQMTREHKGLLELFKEVADHERDEHKEIIKNLIKINVRIESKKGGA